MDIRRRTIMSTKSNSSVNPGGGSESEGSYTITLNNQWRKSSTISNPDSTKYDGVYESYSNYNVNNGVAIMYIDITGYTDFKLFIRSYAESSFDYVMVSQLDKAITGSSSYSNTTLVKAHTRGNQQSGTTIGSYTLVEFNNIDGGSHRITILYRKDSSANNNDDRGYLLIAGNTGVDINTTFSITYTSTDGNIVKPYGGASWSNSAIISNTYIGGVGSICFDRPITRIPYLAFYNCTNLKSIIVPDSITEIGQQAFYGCSNLTSVDIPNSVTLIEKWAFEDCSSLTSIIIPNSVNSIKGALFAGCSSLTSVTIPDSVTSIEGAAFRYCTSLKSITIPDSVTSIGTDAFYGCSSLMSIYCKPTTPPTLGNTVLDGIYRYFTIYVPTEAVETYKSASGWATYADDIVGYYF